MSPYEKGWGDFERGKTLRDNPYHRATADHLWWRNGWNHHQESLWHDERLWGENH